MVFCCIKFKIVVRYVCCLFFFFQAEDGIRDLVRSRGLGDVYKRQVKWRIGDIAGKLVVFSFREAGTIWLRG